MSATPSIVLASSSPYRRQLLGQLGIDFTTESPAIEETPKAGESAHKLALRLALEKARAVAVNHPNSLIIGSDQVAELDGRVLAKPGSIERACRQLRDCSGRHVDFFTGLCLIDTRNGEEQAIVDRFRVWFRQLTAEQVSRYVDREQPLDCAGSFKAEGLGISLFERMEGNDPNTLIGLPLIQLVTLLNNRGIAIP